MILSNENLFNLIHLHIIKIPQFDWLREVTLPSQKPINRQESWR